MKARGATPFPFDRLVRVTRGSVQAARLLAPRLNAAALSEVAATLAPAVGIGMRVSCLALDAGAGSSREHDAPPVVASLSLASGGRAWVILDAPLAVDLVSRLLRVDEIAAPRPITRAERGLLSYLALLALRVAPGWRLDSVTTRPHAFPENAVAAEIEVVLGDGPRHGARLVTDLSTLLHLPAPPPRWDRTARLGRVALDAAVVVATVRLSVAEIRSLAPGDIVVLDADPAAELRVGGGWFPLEVASDRLRVTGPYQPRGRLMGEAMDEKRDLLEGMPLDLTAEIGRLRLSGRELLDLEPGTVLPLGRPTSGPIELTCAGRVVARGELVDVEGERGVRVTEILA